MSKRQQRKLQTGVLVACLFILSGACGASTEPTSKGHGIPEPVQVDPPEPSLTRITQAQYGHAIVDLLGPDIAVPTSLEPDVALEHLIAIGSSSTTISPRGAEKYEEAARSVARQVVENEALRQSLTLCESMREWPACYEKFAVDFGRRVWRRPISAEEADTLVGLATQAQQALGLSEGGSVVEDDYYLGIEMMLSALFQSPHFLYRVELGEPLPDDPTNHRVTGYEMASRLSFFFWNSVPDLALLDAAEAGFLGTSEERLVHVQRMMDDPKLRRSVRNFFWEWWQLFELDQLTKDPTIYKHYSSDLGVMAAEETLQLVEHVVLDRDVDMVELLTTRTTFVNRRLAAIYNIPAVVEDGFGMTELPADGLRRGFLGHVSFLAQNAHPVSTSPTLRGLFVRELLLCESIPPPLSEVNTALPEPTPDAKTMRERLTVHMEDPTCAGCHALTDLVGLTLENFDGIGRFRWTENEVTIDASGELDGVTYNDALGLQETLGENPKFARCAVNMLYSYALGRPLGAGDTDQYLQLTERFEANGRRFKQLMVDVALSTGFERVGEVSP
jgi:hypothetical protein